jgi:hypothetical protein
MDTTHVITPFDSLMVKTDTVQAITPSDSLSGKTDTAKRQEIISTPTPTIIRDTTKRQKIIITPPENPVIDADTTSLNILPDFDETSIFGGNSVVYNKVSEISEMRPRTDTDTFVKSGAAIGLAIYFLLILFFLKGRVSKISKMFTDYHFVKKQYDETTSIKAVNTTQLMLFTIVVMAIQFSLLSNYPDYKMALIPFFALSGIFIFQSALMRLTGWICKSEAMLGEIDFNRQIYLSTLGIIILPLTLSALLYGGTKVENTAFVISEILLAFVLIFMVIRLLTVFDQAKTPYFFRLLYFCVFELSPYLILFIVF